MKRIVQIAIVVMGLLTIPVVQGQTGKGAADEQQIIAMIKEIQAQQATIADNQSKIDAKLAAVAEAIRVARIYGSRGGR